MKGYRMGQTIAFLLSILVLGGGLTTPLSVEAAASCDSICSLNVDNAKTMIKDPKCKSNQGCVNCVVQSLTQSQSGAYCSGYEKSTKSQGIEKVTAGMNTAAAVACGVACAWASNEIAGKICAFGGLGIMAYEIGETVVKLTKSESDMLSLVTQGISLEGKARSSFGTLNNLKAIKAGSDAAKKGLKNPACGNAVIFTLTATQKIISMNQMKKSAQQACGTVEQLSTTLDGPIQACLAKVSPNTIGGTSLAGLIETNTTMVAGRQATLDDLNQYASSAKGTDPYLRDMREGLKKASDAGIVDLNDIMAKLDSGVSPASILASVDGIPGEVASVAKAIDEQLKRGEKSDFVAALVGGGYSPSGAGGARSLASKGDPFSEMSFGSEATPGEGHETLEIEKNANMDSKPGFFAGDDIFHSDFPGTIFEIITGRIQEQKDRYAELEPEGRMNRVFNGYSDPKRRSPASKSGE